MLLNEEENAPPSYHRSSCETNASSNNLMYLSVANGDRGIYLQFCADREDVRSPSASYIPIKFMPVYIMQLMRFQRQV